jgi:translocation and assembly module TamA
MALESALAKCSARVESDLWPIDADKTPHEAHCASMSSCRALLLLFAALVDAPLSRAADPQRYRVHLLSTGDKARDATLEETSQLQTLHTAAPVDAAGLIARARGDVVRLRVVLESFGYYQSSVSIHINGVALDDPSVADMLSALPPGTDAQCRITFTLGPLYHLGRIDIDGMLPAAVRGALELASGAPAVAANVLEAGVRLQATLEDRGFAFAKVDPPIAYERADEHVLDVRFHVETGPKVKLGEIRIEGLRAVHESLLRARLPFHPGDPYSATKLDAARRDLLGLGVFVTVSVRLGNGTDSLGRVPVIFRVRERPRDAISVRAVRSHPLLRQSFEHTTSDLGPIRPGRLRQLVCITGYYRGSGSRARLRSPRVTYSPAVACAGMPLRHRPSIARASWVRHAP